MRREPLEWTLFGVIPVLLVLTFTFGSMHHQPAYDFRAMWQAGHAVAHGHDPYPTVASIPTGPKARYDEFIYPAVVAVVMVPFGLMPFGVAAGLFVAVLVASVAATLRLLGVRDWRCYGVAFASVPVLESFRLGTLSPLLALGVAGAWVARDRRWTLPAVVAAVVLAKLFLWPLFVWLIATRRWGAAARSALLTVVVAAIGWAVVGFDTLAPYPALLRKMTDAQLHNTVGLAGLLTSLGAGASTAHLGVLLVAALGSAAIVATARRQQAPELAFGLTLFVALVASPISWLNYNALLLVPIALASRRLSAWWLLLLAFWVAPMPYSGGSTWRIVVPIAVAAVATLGRRDAAGSLIRWSPLRGVAQPG